MFTSVAVAPVSSANRKTTLPIGPHNSAGTTINPLLRIEGEGHKTTAVSFGIFPVYRIAKRVGRNSTALR